MKVITFNHEPRGTQVGTGTVETKFGLAVRGIAFHRQGEERWTEFPPPCATILALAESARPIWDREAWNALDRYWLVEGHRAGQREEKRKAASQRNYT